MNGQTTLTYLLSTNLEESQGQHQDLKQLANTPGETGFFDKFTVPITTCPTSFDVDGYHFFDNAGLRFENNGLIDCEYTIQFTFHIKELSGPQAWVRLINFNPSEDSGIYIKITNSPTSGTLEFYPNGVVGAANFFNAIDLYQFFITRTCAGLVNIYVNGEFFANYDDSSNPLYLVHSSEDIIDFFQDDTEVANEASPGWVKNIVISDNAKDLAFVEEEWGKLCEVLQETDCAGTPNGAAVTDDCGNCLEMNDPNFNNGCDDCAGVMNGQSIIDSCGICLLPSDPNFNQSCADCAGIPNGEAIIDSCGVCHLPSDPEFNQSCADCAGVPNGPAVLDDCGNCLLASDPNFNKGCDDCAGIPNGPSELDECGVCHLPSDPEFNQSCADCAGIPNGDAIIDSCGVCLVPTDPSFNQSCADCAGVPNGTSLLDECGVCLLPDAPDFNQSCIDCKGVPNGSATIDECGECLDAGDPNYNKSCTIQFYFPSAFSPNDDGLNDFFEVFRSEEAIASIKSYKIFNLWGELIFQSNNFEFGDLSKYWGGEMNGQKVQGGVYIYLIDILFENGKISTFSGDFTIIE